MCRVTGCTNPPYRYGRCTRHCSDPKLRGRRHFKKVRPRAPYCTVDGCQEFHSAKGLCKYHYNKQRYRNPEVRRKAQEAADRAHRENPTMRRKLQLQYNFGLTIEDDQGMLEKQGGRCAICGTTHPGGSGKHFHVDPCHQTDKIPGATVLGL
jgi:hypothetical protein